MSSVGPPALDKRRALARAYNVRPTIAYFRGVSTMTVVENQARRPRRQSALSQLSLVLALGLVLAACGKQESAPQTATGPAAVVRPLHRLA